MSVKYLSKRNLRAPLFPYETLVRLRGGGGANIFQISKGVKAINENWKINQHCVLRSVGKSRTMLGLLTIVIVVVIVVVVVVVVVHLLLV